MNHAATQVNQGLNAFNTLCSGGTQDCAWGAPSYSQESAQHSQHNSAQQQQTSSSTQQQQNYGLFNPGHSYSSGSGDAAGQQQLSSVGLGSADHARQQQLSSAGLGSSGGESSTQGGLGATQHSLHQPPSNTAQQQHHHQPNTAQQQHHHQQRGVADGGVGNGGSSTQQLLVPLVNPLGVALNQATSAHHGTSSSVALNQPTSSHHQHLYNQQASALQHQHNQQAAVDAGVAGRMNPPTQLGLQVGAPQQLPGAMVPSSSGGGPPLGGGTAGAPVVPGGHTSGATPALSAVDLFSSASGSKELWRRWLGRHERLRNCAETVARLKQAGAPVRLEEFRAFLDVILQDKLGFELASHVGNYMLSHNIV